MRRTLVFFASVVALYALFGLQNGTALAEEIEERVYELGEIVVTAPRDVVEAVGTVNQIFAREIAQRGSRTLDEAIGLLPSLNVRVGGEGTPRVDIRGFRTRHVKLLLDGIPMNDTYDGQFDPTTIPVEYISRIKVTTGGGSVLYGPGGNGGIINVITQKGRRGIRGSLATEMGQGDAYRGKITLSGAWDRWNVFLSATPSSSDGYRLADSFAETDAEDGGLRENSARKRQNIFASVNYVPSRKTLLGLTFNALRGENGVPPVANYDKNDPFTKKPKYDRVDDLEGYAAQIALSHYSDGPVSVKGWAFLNRLDLEDNRYDDAEYSTQVKNGASHTESRTQISGAHLQMTYRPETWGAATLALMAENDNWDASGFSVGKKDVREDFDANRDIQVYTAALQYDISPLKELGFAFGCGLHLQNKEEGEGDEDVSYLLGARYRLSEQTQIKASHARKIRSPSIRQLYDTKSGNEDLNAERTQHYELGVQQDLSTTTSLSVTGFAIDAKDFIEKTGDSAYENFEEYRFRGVEVVTEDRSVENLSLKVGYAYLHSENRSPDDDRDVLQNRPRDKFTAEGTYRFPFGLDAHLSLQHVANQYFYDSDGEPPLQKQALNDYTLVHIRLKQRLLENRVSIYVGADNLFDENYEQSYGLPQPGRTLYGGLEYPF